MFNTHPLYIDIDSDHIDITNIHKAGINATNQICFCIDVNRSLLRSLFFNQTAIPTNANPANN